MSALKKISMTVLGVALVSILFATSAEAYKYKYRNIWRLAQIVYVPVAICETSGTHISISPYVCCKLKTGKHTYAWRHTWVAGACMNASPYARGDMGCGVDSLVFGTNGPIIADCQFSDSTGKYTKFYRKYM